MLGHTMPVTSVEFSIDSELILTASLDGTARMYNLIDGTLRKVLKGHAGPVNTAVFTTGGLILTGSDDCTIKLWSYSGFAIFTYSKHTGPINSIIVVDEN